MCADFKTPVRTSVGRKKSSDTVSPAFTIPPSPFMKHLGYGTGVNVFLFSRESLSTPGKVRSPWAVKKINKRVARNNLPTYEERLRHEANILKQLKHPNIVGYRGFSRSQDGTLCLCMESGEKSLFDLIEQRQEKENTPFHPGQILKVAMEVTSALSYLHNEKKLLHGDLKSHNVLIKGDFKEVKLCDFGVTVQMNEDMSDVRDPGQCYIGSECWTAMEALIGDSVSDKADIWAFGCLLYELLTLAVPHSEHFMPTEMDDSMDSIEEEFDEEAYQESLGTRPVLPKDFITKNPGHKQIVELFCCCTNPEPQDRPSAQKILSALQDIENLQ